VIPILTALTALAAPAPAVEFSTALWQVAPTAGEKAWEVPAKSADKTRAVVLIPGLYVHPLRPAKATQPAHRPWQEPKSELVKALAKDFDVFAFGYAQTISVDDVALSFGLRDAVARLRRSGYTEIVLVGHSAGGVIARQFAENFPDAGVTKVIAVAAPFAGAEAATFKIGYPKVQAPFVKSLTPEARTGAVRANKHPLRNDVQIVCVVCKLKHIETDGLVFIRSQWPDDLQRFGVPAVLAPVSHFDAMHSAATAKTIAELARERLKRWPPEDVERAKKELFAEAREK
jgi:pimeloyl-ACP methyl ester carboxylesterase